MLLRARAPPEQQAKLRGAGLRADDEEPPPNKGRTLGAQNGRNVRSPQGAHDGEKATTKRKWRAAPRRNAG